VQLRPEVVALAAYRQGRPARPGGFKLSSNENPYPPIPAVVAAIAASSVNRYPEQAATALRARLADRLGVDADRIQVGAGSVALLHALTSAAMGQGDEIVYAWRSFEHYPVLAAVAGARAVEVPVDADGRHDLAAMAAAVTPATRVVIVCSPNNPTGTTVGTDEFAAFMAAVPPHVLVLLDEAYAEFVTDADAVRGAEQLGRYPNLVLLRTFSKAFGLAGLRVGYAAGPEYVLDASRAAAVPLSVTEPAQRAALAALDHEPELSARVDALVVQRDRLATGLRHLGLDVPEAQGNFVWLGTGPATGRAADAFDAAGVAVRAFPPDGIRVSVGEPESVDAVLRIAAGFVGNL